MSLLLDALKKAAKENSNVESDSDEDAPITLELDSTEEVESASNEATTIDLGSEGFNDNGVHSGADEMALVGSDVHSQTVSDEALQVLVHKANKQFDASQKIVWGSILAGMFFILFVGGVYFYISMSDDVASLERKHKLVIRSVTDTRLSKTVTEKVDSQQEYGEEHESSGFQGSEVNTQPVTKQTAKSVTNKLVIKKATKLDPIDLLATRAWNAYREGDYGKAREIYADILSREENNRDALLGIAAIAVKQGDIESAQAVYRELVQINPRDPIAVAALANLEATKLSDLDESKLKLMIRKNDNPSHLHFALGNLYSGQSRWPEAQKSYFEAWQSDNKNSDYAYNLAVSLDQLGKPQEAIRFYEISIKNAEMSNAQFSIEAAESRLQQLSNGQ